MKTKILFALILLAGIALAVLGIYDYQHRPTTESLNTALTAQKTLESEVKDLQLHDSVDLTNSKDYQALAISYQNQKNQVCSVLTSHKLTNPVCN